MKDQLMLRQAPHGAWLLLLVALLVGCAALLTGCGGGGGGSDSPTVVAPSITTQPRSQTVLAGDTVTLTVTATGTDLQYQWFKDGVAINGKTSNSLTITNASASDEAGYAVTVSNSAGSATSNTATLTVNTDTGDAGVVIK